MDALHVGMNPGPIIYGPKGEQIADCRSVSHTDEENKVWANAIVRACNAHDDLVAALEVVRRSSGWGSLAAETRALIDVALAKAGAL